MPSSVDVEFVVDVVKHREFDELLPPFFRIESDGVAGDVSGCASWRNEEKARQDIAIGDVRKHDEPTIVLRSLANRDRASGVEHIFDLLSPRRRIQHVLHSLTRKVWSPEW